MTGSGSQAASKEGSPATSKEGSQAASEEGSKAASKEGSQAASKEASQASSKATSQVGSRADSQAATPKASAGGSGIDLDASHSYQIRPNFENKFRPQAVKEQIRITLNEELGGRTYSETEAEVWIKNISDHLRTKMKEMGFERYKIVVQTVIGEQHGEGVKMGVRCLWDSDTDNYASEVFINETMFCVAAVYGVYYY